MLDKIKEYVYENKKHIIIVIALLVVCVFAYNVWSAGNVSTDGITTDGVEKQFKSVESKQSAVTNSIDGIETRLRDSQATVRESTSELTEARTANTRVIERYGTSQEIINSNTRAIENLERLISEVESSRKE